MTGFVVARPRVVRVGVNVGSRPNRIFHRVVSPDELFLLIVAWPGNFSRISRSRVQPFRGPTDLVFRGRLLHKGVIWVVMAWSGRVSRPG